MADQNWAWFVIAGCAVVLRRSLRHKGGIVSSLKISPGEQVLISVHDRSTSIGAPDPAPVAANSED
jgi:hypothetical protein